jgi:hypothetical protein
MTLRKLTLAAATLLTMLAPYGAQAQNTLTGAGYNETFDVMGTLGITPPLGWSVFSGPSGTSNSTWTTSITAAGVAAMTSSGAALTATNNPTANANNGYNAAFSAGSTADRLIATAPTTVSGAAIQLALINLTGSALNEISLSYDTRRFTSATTANELPGYWLFTSTDNGSSWNNVVALNPTLSTVPNTVGVSTVSNALVTLGATVPNGGSLLLRWVDDNATQTSPDQILGLNNVAISAVPEPGTALMLLAGVAALAGVVRRRSA